VAEVLPVRIVKDVATLKAVADPIRLTVLERAMAEPARLWTAKEFAAEVGIPPTKIYYHLNLLEQHGLLQVRETRLVNGILEKRYGTGQLDLTFHCRAGGTGTEDGSGVGELATKLLQQTRDEIATGLATGHVSATPDAPETERMLLSRAVAELPASRLAEFRQELLALVRRFEQASEPGAPRFALLVALHPSVAGHTPPEPTA